MKHTLPALGYAFDALEPHIDARTMEIHYTKHHQAYVDKLNEALSEYPDFQGKPVEELLVFIDAVPEKIRNAVQNNGGGHYNHMRFWTFMRPEGKKEPEGKLRDALDAAFGGLEDFKKAFKDEALKRFGSGWVWLHLDKSKKPALISTPNQNSTLMQGIVPLLGLDVWEHAYYLTYQNRRGDYIDAWWNVVNWEEVEKNYEKEILRA
jgi:Fe-Mn family superoxide dismutase